METDLNVRNLHVASAQGDVAEITRLLSQNGRLLEAELLEKTPLMQALQERQSECIKVLLGRGANAKARSVSGLTCLFYAIKSEIPYHVALLLEAGADPSESSHKGRNGLAIRKEHDALACAVENTTVDALHLLIAYGRVIDTGDAVDKMCMRNAMQLRKPMHLLVLLAFSKPRELVARQDGHEIPREIELILDKWSSRTEDIECRTVLRKHIGPGGTLNYHSLLAWAAENKKLQTLEYILDSSPDPEILETRFEGWNAIHYAARGGERKVIKRLLQRGSRIDCLTVQREQTPLLIAAENGRQRTTRMLLENGADIFAVTHDACTVFDFACKGEHEKTIQVLDEFVNAIEDPVLRRGAQMMSTKSKGRYAIVPYSSRVEDVDWQHHGSSSVYQEVSTGTFDSYNYAMPANDSKLNEPRFFDHVTETCRRNYEFHEKDGVVKIAILDTGLDSTHAYFGRSDGREYVIKSCKNFCGHVRAEDNVTDLDGHGTAVAGIILRLAPRSEVYIARICAGVSNSGEPEHPQPDAVAQAINWAVGQGVDLINMSFGFDENNLSVKRALKNANNHCIVFAAASNDGNFKRMAWPARDPDLVIGVHSSNSEGTKASDFSPPPNDHDPMNFMVVGEDIPVNQLVSQGAGFKPCSGTSFATPVAVAVAGLILAFVRQKRCTVERNRLEDHIADLYEISGMRKVLRKISSPVSNGRYHWIHPQLLWKDFRPQFEAEEGRRAYAWRILREALDN